LVGSRWIVERASAGTERRLNHSCLRFLRRLNSCVRAFCRLTERTNA
jgi:hypothetical protein